MNRPRYSSAIRDPREHEYYNSYIDDVAHRAVKQTFAILGVNIDEPSEVEEFRRDLRFSGDLRRFYTKGFFAFATIVAGLIATAIWTGLTATLKD